MSDMTRLGDEKVRKVLKNFGLTEKETEVYIFLAKHGVLRSGEISKGIKTHRAEVYRMLKSLQSKGLVQSTLESPTRFTTVPFETILDSFIKTKREEAASVESAKQDLLDDWKRISRHEPEPSLEKFVVIEGNHKIYSKILQMMKETKSQLSAVSTVSGLMRADQFGLFDAAFDHLVGSKVQFRFITDLSSQNLNFMKILLKRIPKAGFNIKGRNPTLGLKLSPRMVIKDEDEIIFFIKPKTDIAASEQDDVCFWTNCKTLVQSFIAVFEDLWGNATEIEKRIVEIETGKLTPRTSIISDAQVAKTKYDEIIRSTKEEIFMMTSSEGLLELLEFTPLLKEWSKRGVSVKIMAPITGENLKAVQQLLDCCEVRHVATSYLRTTIVDGQHLFQFKTTSSDEEKPEATTYFENTFYTNDLEYIEKTMNMMNDVWQKARASSTVTLESITRSFMPTITPLSDNEYVFSRPESPYRKMTTFIEEKPEILTEKDVLNKIINAKKYPAKNWPKDILRYYGGGGSAVIHPPEYFHLPDMIIFVRRWDKQSSWGAEDWLMVFLWLETPTGYAYVPVAFVTDNPRAVEFQKTIYAGTPVAQNVQLVKKDELQIRVHGNTLFAGWTVPIPLFPPRYALPPSCMLLEGYSRLKTTVSKWELPSGVKITVEGNGYDAFVTFFHSASKYAGPGTDGTVSRDQFMTEYPPSDK